MKTRKTQLAKAKKKSYWNERRDRKKVRVRTKMNEFEGTNEYIVKAAQKITTIIIIRLHKSDTRFLN